MQKDYYKTLGVVQDAEDIVIKAAYKALAQRYHPDKWTGDPAEAARRMSEINAAYEILSDPIKRKQYDQSRTSNEYDESDEAPNEAGDDSGTALDEDWKEAVKYFPDLESIFENLSKISWSLAQTYKVYLLKNKNFPERESIAAQFEKTFLEKYFGTNEEIIKFAKFLITAKNKNAAKDLNRAINLLGRNVDSNLIINRILRDYPEISKANMYRKVYQSPPEVTDNQFKLFIFLILPVILLSMLAIL